MKSVPGGHWLAAKRIVVLVAVAGLVAVMAGAAPTLAQEAGAIDDSPGCRTNTLLANDDESTGAIPLPFTVNLFGTDYGSLFVNNNGNVTFDEPLAEYTPFDLSTTERVIIAPFFADVDTRGEGSGEVTYGETTFGGRDAFCVNWIDVGYYSANTDKLNSFQLLLVDRSDTGAGNFDIVFNYDKVQWETGDASGGSGGLGGSSAGVGYSNGGGGEDGGGEPQLQSLSPTSVRYGAAKEEAAKNGDAEPSSEEQTEAMSAAQASNGVSFELPGSGVPGSFLDSDSGGLIHGSRNSLQLGRYVFTVRNGDLGSTGGEDDFGPDKNGNQSSVGDPINLTTGNAHDYKQDLFVPARGVPLQFVRFYNSQDYYSGPLGHGWTHAYNTSLQENDDGSVTEMDPQGARLTFPRNPDGSYAAPMGVHDTLTRGSNGAFVLRKQDGMEWRFDSGGKLLEIADPNGNALSFSYDADGRLQKVTDAVGRDTSLAYDPSGRITRITDPAGREVLYGYSAEGDLTSVTDPSGSVTRYEYDASHNLTRTTNPKGGATTFAYDDQDRAVSSESDGGYEGITLDYQPEEGRTLVTDSKGNESAFYYDAYQRVTKIVDPYGEEIQYGWDSEGHKTSVTDQLGNTTSYDYDDRDNLTKVIQPRPTAQATANPTTTMTYEPTFNRVTSVTDPEGGITRHAYDAKGNLTETTDALGEETTFEYDANGQLTQSTDPKSNATTYAYDAAGNPTGITDPAGKTTGFAYGAAGSLASLLGLPSSVTDPIGRATKFFYDAMGRVTRTTNPDGSTARTSYDAMGNVTGVTNERGNTWSSAYDPLGRLSSETDPLGNKTLYEYDTEGNLVGLTDPAGTKTTYVYDKVRRLLTESTPSGGANADGTPRQVSTNFAYDPAGRMIAQTDPNGQTTRFAYDAAGRMTGVTDVATGGSTILQTATYEYDLLGRMTRATNPNGHASTYAYDELGHLTQEIDPLGNATSYAYDPNGNLESRRDAMGRTTGYSYDALDRLTNTAHPDGSSIKRTYNAVGDLTSITDKTGTTRYAYDARHRLTKETLPGNMTLAYSYDPASNRTSLTNPDGKKTLFAYDAADRMTAVTDYAGARTTYAYNALDLPTRVSHPTGASENYAYDPLGRMTRATATGKNGAGAALTLSRLSYAYDKNSNPVSITDKDGKKSTFAYDALDRLTRETHPDRTLSYTYDPAGNRESRVRTDPSGDETTDYSYDAAERMTQAGQTTFSYDENGNMTSRRTSNGATTNYAYDFEDQLVQAGTKTYTRDAFGRAVSSKDGATTTGYLFDGAEVIQEKTGTAAQITYTRGLQDQPVSRRAGANTPTYYHHDAIGSVVALSNSAGKPADTYSYTAFGIMKEHTGTSTQPFTYVGNAYDSSTKLMDFHARMYDPVVGRFTSQDPVAGLATMPQTLNPYAYGINGPLAYPDPSGRCIEPASATVCAAAAFVGKTFLENAAFNSAIYLTRHRNDKNINAADFIVTVGNNSLEDTKGDLVNPLTYIPFVKEIRLVSKRPKYLWEANELKGWFDRGAKFVDAIRNPASSAAGTNYYLNRASADKGSYNPWRYDSVVYGV